MANARLGLHIWSPSEAPGIGQAAPSTFYMVATHSAAFSALRTGQWDDPFCDGKDAKGFDKVVSEMQQTGLLQ